MNMLICFCPVLSCRVVWNAGFGRTAETTTKGGRDKRTGVQARYVPVVVGLLSCCASAHSAVCISKALIRYHFYRAISHFLGSDA